MSSAPASAVLDSQLHRAARPQPARHRAETLAPITPRRVRAVLRALRHAEPLPGNAMLELALVRRRLRRDGLAPSREAREWVLGMLLAERVAAELARYGREPAAGACLPCEHARRQLAAHCGSGDPARQSWAIVQYRYFTACEEPSATASRITGLSTRTLRRRIRWGVESLAERLRAEEMAAA